MIVAADIDPLAEDELSRYDTGRRHGISQALDLPAFFEIALELELLRATVRTLSAELEKRDRTIRAYQAIIRSAP